MPHTALCATRHSGQAPDWISLRQIVVGGRALAGTIIVLILLFVAIFVTFSSIKTVPQGFEYTVQRFGR